MVIVVGLVVFFIFVRKLKVCERETGCGPGPEEEVEIGVRRKGWDTPLHQPINRQLLEGLVGRRREGQSTR